MKSRKTKDDLRELCAEVHEDDCVDPREAFSRTTRQFKKENRKTLQLCKQAAWTIDVALRCEAADPMLNTLEVVDVSPAPDSKRLRVRVRPADDEIYDDDSILARLTTARGFLRAALAADVTRKRVPELIFQIVPRSAESDGGE